MYLVKGPSIGITHESMKPFKSLDSYNFFLCGHVQDVYYHNIDAKSEFCYIKTEVLPSQSQGQKQKLYEVWVALHQKGDWVLTANCTCMAGLGSACSHVGALLFKLQAGGLLGINKIACTSKLCAWKRSRRFAEPALTGDRLQQTKAEANSTQRKKVMSDRMKKPFSFRDPTHINNEFHKQKLKELYSKSRCNSY